MKRYKVYSTCLETGRIFTFYIKESCIDYARSLAYEKCLQYESILNDIFEV